MVRWVLRPGNTERRFVWKKKQNCRSMKWRSPPHRYASVTFLTIVFYLLRVKIKLYINNNNIIIHINASHWMVRHWTWSHLTGNRSSSFFFCKFIPIIHHHLEHSEKNSDFLRYSLLFFTFFFLCHFFFWNK